MESTCVHSIDLQKYLPMVRHMAWSMAQRVPGLVPVDDLNSEGLLALVEARNRYDPVRGASFSTYVWVCVRSKMLNLVEKECQHGRRRVLLSNQDSMGPTSRGAVNHDNPLVFFETLDYLRPQYALLALAMVFGADIRQASELCCMSVGWSRRVWRRTWPKLLDVLDGDVMCGSEEALVGAV